MKGYLLVGLRQALQSVGSRADLPRIPVTIDTDCAGIERPRWANLSNLLLCSLDQVGHDEPPRENYDTV
jgi:hypothetical protein